MFKKLSEDIIKSKTATGVEIILLPDGGYEINAVILKREKSEVVTKTRSSGIKDISSLFQIIDAKSPIVLVINGKGIIHRKIAVAENDSLSAVLNKVLPNANLNEFYIQKQKVSVSQIYVSVVRTAVLNDVLEALKENKITNVAHCYLGPFVLNNVLSLIDKNNIANEFLTIGNHKLLIREDRIHEVQPIDESENKAIKIGDELIEEKLAISFAAALSYFTGAEEGIINSEKIDSIKDDFKQKQKFQLFGWSLLVASFTILIVNYFIFNHYWEKSNEMNSKLVMNQSALKRYESLKAEYSQKKIFLEQNGLLETSRTSYFADQLAASIPLSIQLLDLDIHPLKKKELNDLTNAFYFDNKIIKISGKCDRNTELNDWMKKLETNNWIEKVKLLDYKQANAKDDGVFFIEIKLK